MAANNKQFITVVDIVPGTQQLIEAKLALGFAIMAIVSLTPVYNKLLIIYTLPESI